MVKFKKKNNYKFWHSPLALIILLAAVVFFSYNISNLAKKSRETSEKTDLLSKDIQYLQDKINYLNSDIANLNTELGRENELRNKFPVTKEGEKIVTIIDEKNNQDEILPTEVKKSVWSRLLNVFKKE